LNAEKPRARRLSEIVVSLEGRNDLNIGVLAEAFGERALGALMFVFAVPNVIPTPPGTSAVLGLPLVFLTFQLMIGRDTLWLPAKIRNRPISAGLISSFITRAGPYLARFEKVLRPRFSLLVHNNAAERLIGLVSFCMAVVLFLPIPFGNILPAAAIAVLALGLAERDGFAAIFGYALVAVSCFVLVLISSALYAAALVFFHTLFGV
jgi:hypothetical protein